MFCCFDLPIGGLRKLGFAGGDELLGKALLSAGSVYPGGYEGFLELKAPVKTEVDRGGEKRPERISKSQLHVSTTAN